MLGDRSFAKRQILRFDHGYAIESLPAQPALPQPAAIAQLADVVPFEEAAAPAETHHGVPSWVANDRKVQIRRALLAAPRGIERPDCECVRMC